MHLLCTCHRASAPTHRARVPLQLLCPCTAQQPLHPLLLAHGVHRHHQRCFRSDLTLPPPSRWRQGRELCLRMGQTFFQPCCLALGMPGRPHHPYPFTPFLGAALQATRSLSLIALGRSDRCTAVIGAEHPCQLALAVLPHPLRDPCLHGLSRRACPWQRRQRKVRAPRSMRAGGQRTPRPIADLQQAGGLQPGLDPLDAWHISPILGAFARAPIRRSRHPQRVQRPWHHFALGPTRIILPGAKRPQAPLRHVVVTRDGGGLTAHHGRGPGRDGDAPRLAVPCDPVPRVRLAAVPQQMSAPVITAIQGGANRPTPVAEGGAGPGWRRPPPPVGDRLP
jgi:hypothetical protein